MPMTGQPILAARSITLHIFSLMTSPSEPPNTVKSWLNTHTRRPSIVPWPVTTASPQGRVLSMPNSVRAMADVRVELLEGAGVEQLLDPLAGRVLALRVLLLHRLLGGVVDGGVAQLLELLELLYVRLEGFLAHGRGESMLPPCEGGELLVREPQVGSACCDRLPDRALRPRHA